jgi:hypothetical protein
MDGAVAFSWTVSWSDGTQPQLDGTFHLHLLESTTS